MKDAPVDMKKLDSIKDAEKFDEQEAYFELVDLYMREGSIESAISIAKKGGHVVYLNSDRNVNTEVISQDEANEIGKKYLDEKVLKYIIDNRLYLN